MVTRGDQTDLPFTIGHQAAWVFMLCDVEQLSGNSIDTGAADNHIIVCIDIHHFAVEQRLTDAHLELFERGSEICGSDHIRSGCVSPDDEYEMIGELREICQGFRNIAAVRHAAGTALPAVAAAVATAREFGDWNAGLQCRASVMDTRCCSLVLAGSTIFGTITLIFDTRAGAIATEVSLGKIWSEGGSNG